MLQIIVDRGRCMGAGECVHVAPASFRLDETVTSTVIDPPGDDEPALLDAALSCPNSAITIVRDGVAVQASSEE